MKKQFKIVRSLCLLSAVFLLFAGASLADQQRELLPPGVSPHGSYTDVDDPPEYVGEPYQPDMAVEAEGEPTGAGVSGGVIVVSELPEAVVLEGVAPRAHIQGEFIQHQGEAEGSEVETFIGEIDGLPETKTPSAERTGVPGTNVRTWTAIQSTGWIPPDTIAAIGPSHVVETVNSHFIVYNKTGSVARGLTDFRNFVNRPAGFQGFIFDPRVIYDPWHRKFVILVLGRDDTNRKSYVWIAISRTTNATGAWWIWRFDVTRGGGTQWLDYAGVGADPWGVYVTGQYFGFTAGFFGSQIWSINPAAFSGGATNGWRFVPIRWPSGAQAFSAQPAQPHSRSSTATTYFVNTFSGSGNQVNLHKLSGNRTNRPRLVRVAIRTPGYRAIGGNVDQPGSATDIDGGDARVMNAVYAQRRVWYTLTTDPRGNGSAAGWLTVKLNTSSNSREWSHLLWGGHGWYYFYPAIALRGSSVNGRLFVAGSGTNSTSLPASSLFKIYTSHPGSAAGPFTVFNRGSGPYRRLDNNGRNRWGDYSGAGYDWSTGNFMGAAESARSSTTWRTVITIRRSN